MQRKTRYGILIFVISLVTLLAYNFINKHQTSQLELSDLQLTPDPQPDEHTEFLEPDKEEETPSLATEPDDIPAAIKSKTYRLNVDAFETLTVDQILQRVSLRLDCNGYKKINDDEQLQSFLDFTEEHILYNYEQLKPYALYSKEELQNYAEIGDNLAMYTLGLSYINNSMFEGFVPIFLKYNPDRSDRPKQKPFDEALMDEGISWLRKAASHQYPSALFPISQAYESKIALKKAHFIRDEASTEELIKHDSELSELEYKLVVTKAVLLETFPILNDVPKRGLTSTVSEKINQMPEEQQIKFAADRDAELSLWRQMREQNGYPAVVEYDISSDNFIMGSLKMTFKSLCDGFNK